MRLIIFLVNREKDFPDRVTPSTLDTGGETNISHAATAADLFIHITLHIIAGTIKYAIEFFYNLCIAGDLLSLSNSWGVLRFKNVTPGLN